jgi:three-Cys-motif partner protein
VTGVSDQSFGGEWTESKLRSVSSYLEQYQTALKNQSFTTWYVDAFAGTGSRAVRDFVDLSLGLLAGIDVEEADAGRYKAGSARIALGLPRPFDRYLFIEKSKSKCEELESTIRTDFASLHGRCTIQQEDSNIALCEWCKERNWSRDRAVVFLDPFGLQVEWSTIKSLGATKGIDLWYLFPMSLLRLLKHDGVIEPKWRDRLDAVFGTPEWESRFYERSQSPLFDDVEMIERTATVENVQRFIEERLSTCFVKVAKGAVLKNSRNSPLFLLCFAASNERGAPIAIRIAQSILKG